MPKNLFEIGDLIWSPVFNTGYIAGQPILYQYTDNLGFIKTSYRYLAYFHTETPYIAYVVSPKLQQPATLESIQLVQDHILSVLIPPVQNKRCKIGDIVLHKHAGTGIVLSSNHIIPRLSNRTVHHIYYEHDDNFELNTDNDLIVIQPADNTTHKRAIEILHDKILTPILSATTPVDPNKPTDEVLIQLMNTPISLQ